MTYSHFQFRLLFSPRLDTTSFLATSEFVHVCICLCSGACVGERGCECVLCYLARVLMVTEVIANVKKAEEA